MNFISFTRVIWLLQVGSSEIWFKSYAVFCCTIPVLILVLLFAHSKDKPVLTLVLLFAHSKDKPVLTLVLLFASLQRQAQV